MKGRFDMVICTDRGVRDDGLAGLKVLKPRICRTTSGDTFTRYNSLEPLNRRDTFDLPAMAEAP